MPHADNCWFASNECTYVDVLVMYLVMGLTARSCRSSGLLQNRAPWCTAVDIYSCVDSWIYINQTTAALWLNMQLLLRIYSSLCSKYFPAGVSIELRLVENVSPIWLTFSPPGAIAIIRMSHLNFSLC